MLTSALPLSSDRRFVEGAGGFARWLRMHRGAVAMASLLAFAGPLTFFTGALGVMRLPAAGNVAMVGLWWILYGASLWGLLLITGYAGERLARNRGRTAAAAIWLLAACSAAALTNILTAGRASILIEQGLVHSAPTMHLHGFIFSLVMALLYFAHLRRSREHQRAAARLVAAQTAQRESRRRIAHSRLQEVQARIDPRLLFDLLDTARGLYERDAARAERFLDELIVFLRAALPRLRSAASTLLREVELARAYVGLRALAEGDGVDMAVEVAADAMHARFPPGVLLPLLESVIGGSADTCALTAARAADSCRVVLTLAAAPADAAVAGVRSLLHEMYGAAGSLRVESAGNAVNVVIEVPYELA